MKFYIYLGLFLFLIAGPGTTLIVHTSGAHNGLQHMQYGEEWRWYVYESLIYSVMWGGFVTYMNRDVK